MTLNLVIFNAFSEIIIIITTSAGQRQCAFHRGTTSVMSWIFISFRLYEDHLESVGHTISEYSRLVNTKNLLDRAAHYIDKSRRGTCNLPQKEYCWEHEPRQVEDNEAVIILWNFSFQTYREIKKNHLENTCHPLIDDAAPSEKKKTSLKMYLKLNKYKNLDMWLLKTTILHVETVFNIKDIAN